MKGRGITWVLFIVIVSLVGLFGCGPSYKEGVMKGKVLQEGHIVDLAKGSSDFFDFAAKIYTPLKKEDVASGHIYLRKYAAPDHNDDISNWEATRIFRAYCYGRGGKRYLWKDSNLAWGWSRIIYTCDIDDKTDAALLYEEFYRPNRNLHFDQNWSIVTGNYFDAFLSRIGRMDKYKLQRQAVYVSGVIGKGTE